MDANGTFPAGDAEIPGAAEFSAALRSEKFTPPAADDSEETLGISIIPRRVKRDEIIYMTCQLAIMIDTGVTLSDALDSIIEQEGNPSFRRILKEIHSSVESGEDFSKALGKHPRLFDQTYVSLVKASESTGSLGPMLERIGDYLRKEMETRNKVRSAMAYPTVMAVMAIGVSVFLLAYVLPKFMPLFQRRGMVLPKPTAVMMAISSALTDYWYLWLAGLIVTLVLFFWGRRQPLGRRIWDGFKINMPIIGPMQRKVILSRSIRTLGAMLNGGVPMLESLELCRAVSDNYHYEKLWQHVADEVTQGNQVVKALAGNPLMPSMLVQMISAGENSGQLGNVLERVSVYFDREVENAVKTATTLIEPLMISVMGIVVGGIGLALLLPIFKLSQSPG
jgi:type IV pilus assembly protein PilC